MGTQSPIPNKLCKKMSCSTFIESAHKSTFYSYRFIYGNIYTEFNSKPISEYIYLHCDSTATTFSKCNGKRSFSAELTFKSNFFRKQTAFEENPLTKHISFDGAVDIPVE